MGSGIVFWIVCGCDGYNYVASHTAHDRDVTTPAVLSLLGWQTYNIWSVEWWDTPEHVLNGIIREIERVKTKESAEELVDDFVDDDIEDLEQVEDNLKENDITAPNSNSKEYITGNLPIRFADSAMFSQGYYTESVVEDIRTILEAEAPISRRLLIKRLINNYGISRNGVRINTYLTEVFEVWDWLQAAQRIFSTGNTRSNLKTIRVIDWHQSARHWI